MRLYISASVLLGLASFATRSTACGTHDQGLSDEEFDNQMTRLKDRQVPGRVATELRNVRVFDGFSIGPPTRSEMVEAGTPWFEM
ncbi:hypothetical protein ONZ43_g2975 [Nemania bipapillata]|uniref:Uncharacterized protein n=1 Tax=Nemania bipapillata TaxID=110536 RepID=A0ACC2IYG7_9PEZI|nr:hypothetical protein ONZ43_g2975 [Nemania bipapillata]